MDLSEVFYEAACRMSNEVGSWGRFSCCMASDVAARHGIYDGYDKYSELMGDEQDYNGDFWLTAVGLRQAANDIGWEVKDYRTFMLLMASEAVK